MRCKMRMRNFRKWSGGVGRRGGGGISLATDRNLLSRDITSFSSHLHTSVICGSGDQLGYPNHGR